MKPLFQSFFCPEDCDKKPPKPVEQSLHDRLMDTIANIYKKQYQPTVWTQGGYPTWPTNHNPSPLAKGFMKP